MSRIIKTLLLIAAGIVGLAVLASVALYLFFDPNDFRDEISTEVRKATGRELVIEGDLSLSVFPWIAVEIGRTRLGNAPGFGDEPFLSFENARLSVKLVPLLFKQEVAVGTASLDGFSLNLAVAANGGNNWDDLARALEAPAAEAAEEEEADEDVSRVLDIADIRLTNASISLRDRQAGTDNTVTGLRLETGRIAAGKPFDLDAEFDFAAKPAGVSGHLEFGGTVTVARSGKELSIKGFAIGGQLDGVAAGATGFEFSAPSIAVDLAGEQVTMGRMELGIFGLELAADVEPYSYVTPRPRMALEVRPFSLKELMQALGTEPPPTADPEALGEVSFRANAEVGETSIVLKSMTLAMDDTTLTGQLSLPTTERGAYLFDVTADKINLDRYMAPAEPSGAGGKAAEDEMEIPVDLIRTLNAQGTARLDRAFLSGMTFENVVVGINAGKGQLRLHPITAKLFEGSYSGDVRIDAAGKTPSISVNENITGVQLKPLAGAMFGQENITGTIEGGFKLSGSGPNLAAIRRDLDGNMSFVLADGTWQGTDVWHQLRAARALFKREAPPEPRRPPRTEFSAVSATGTVTDGIFRNSDLLAELPFLQLTGTGSVDLAEGTIDYTMQARVLEQPEFLEPASDAELADFTKAVIPLKITGPLASPSIKPDIGAMAKAEVKRQVEKKGEELKKRLIGELLGGKQETGAPAEEGAEPAPEQQQEPEKEPEKKPEDQLKDALKKLLDQ